MLGRDAAMLRSTRCDEHVTFCAFVAMMAPSKSEYFYAKIVDFFCITLSPPFSSSMNMDPNTDVKL